jgi:ribosomal-protein-alanine N-acetyltransferase
MTPVWRFCECRRHLLDQILAIEADSFAFPWNRNLFLAEFDCREGLNRSVVLTQERYGQLLIAYLFSRIIIDEMHILKIAVAHNWRRRGVASALLTNGFQIARDKGSRQAFLEVRPSNLAARRLYESVGFNLIGNRPNYYPQSGEAALLYRKNLEEIR